MWYDLFQRVSAKGEGKNQKFDLIHGAIKVKQQKVKAKVNVKVKHVDNVQWELHLRSSKGQKGEVSEQVYSTNEIKW